MAFKAALPYRPISLDRFLGLFDQCDPRVLPKGASPLCHDVDFKVASVGMRPAIQNAIQLGTASAQAYAGAQQQIGGSGAGWINAPNIIGPPTGNYASVTLAAGGSPAQIATAGQDNGGANPWSNPGNVGSVSSFAVVSIPFIHPAGSSNILQASGFFSSNPLPPGAVLTGISVSLNAANNIAPNPPHATNFTVQLGQSGAAIGTAKTFLASGSPATSVQGGSTDLWGTSSTPTFTALDVFISAQNFASGTATAEVNNVVVTIYYTLSQTSNLLIAEGYGFSVPGGDTVSGIEISATGYQTAGGSITAQLVSNGTVLGTSKVLPYSSSPSTVLLGGNLDQWGAALTPSIVNSSFFGIAFFASVARNPSAPPIPILPGTFFQGAIRITVYLNSSGNPGFTYIKTFYCPGQGPLTLALDTNGNLWQEVVDTVPGEMNTISTSILPNNRAISTTVDGREFISISDFQSVFDQPRQWDGTNLDRISQVGPGAGPQFVVDTAQYPISASPFGITQDSPQVAIWRVAWGAIVGRDTVETPGTILTIFGAPSQTNFTTGLAIGNIVYLAGIPLMGTNLPSGSGQNPNGTYTITSIGVYAGSGGAVQYFTVTAPQSQGVLGPSGLSGATYQRTVALVQLTNPIPSEDVIVGGNLTISGAGVSTWNSTWTVVGTPTEGQELITSTQLTSNIATYGYSPVSGTAPGWQPSIQVDLGTQITGPSGGLWQVTTAGTTGGSIPAFTTSPQTDNTAVWTKVAGNQFVTVFGTTNGGGIFNVSDAIILTATQNTFTIALVSPNIAAAAEEGSAISGQGNTFEIDPGLTTLGSGNPGTNPILGNSGGGQVVVAGQVSSGQRYGILLFLTRNGLITPASPPVPFFTDESAVSIKFSNLCIGPPDVIARIVAMTAAYPPGTTAAIGGPYYWIEQDVQILDLATGQTVTYNKTIIPDNVSSESGQITLSDAVLLSGTNVIEQGNNALDQREIGSHVFNLEYAGRMFYGGEQTKIDNFVNLTFDGGYLPSAPGLPAGWNIDQALIPLTTLKSPAIGGFSLYILNTGAVFNPTGATFAGISQNAYQDPFSAPIIDPNTAYSVRILARTPSGSTLGSLVVALISAGGIWEFTLPFVSMTQEFAIYEGPLDNPLWQSVPTDLILKVYPLNLGTNTDLEIKRIEIFPTIEPQYKTQLAGSYIEEPEQVDGVTGIIDFSQYNAQPLRAGFKLFDTMYICKTASTVSTEDNDTTEPAGWKERLVSNSIGAFGPLAVDATDGVQSGQDYAIVAERKGLYEFNGGNYTPIAWEIQQIWNLIIPSVAHLVWVKNDLANKRIMVGVPMATPNQWLPEAPFNPFPTQLNVILMCSYIGAQSPSELAAANGVHVSMFTGSLLARDMTRKWTIWQIPTNCAEWITRILGNQPLWFGGAGGTGKLYELTPGVTNDDGAVIHERYVTYPFADGLSQQEAQTGAVRKLYPYASILLEGSGAVDINAYPETLATPYKTTQPGFPLANPALTNTQVPLNITGNRVFLDFVVDGKLGSAFDLIQAIVMASPDPKLPTEGL